ncbi:MAG: YihY/virulence factor BrkB family protein [Bacteroidota bacterium]|nr:YihY/virulence factor BrkB family protein [Bacteroidota bacterium]
MTTKPKQTLVGRFNQFIFHDLWHADTKLLPKYKAFGYTMMKIGSVTYDEWVKGRLVYRASALTYFTLLSIVPVFALLFGIAKGFGMETLLTQWMQEHLDWAGDALPTILDFTKSLLAHTKGEVVAGVGLLFLFYSVIQMFGYIEKALNDIRHVEKQRTWVRKFTDYLAMMILTPVFLIASSSAMIYLSHTLQSVTDQAEINWLFKAFFSFVPYLMSWFLFACMYTIMPNVRVKIKPVIIASIIAGTAFQLLQFVYINFQVGVARNNAIYGSFAALPLLLIFLYYTWNIFLLGANIAYTIENIKRIEIERSVVSLSIRKQKIAYLFLIHYIVKCFERRENPPVVLTLAKAIKLPEHVVQTMLTKLTDAGIIREVIIPDTDKTGYQPAFAILQMTLGMLMETIEKKIDEHGSLRDVEITNQLEEILDEYDTQFSKANVLIKDL